MKVSKTIRIEDKFLDSFDRQYGKKLLSEFVNRVLQCIMEQPDLFYKLFFGEKKW